MCFAAELIINRNNGLGLFTISRQLNFTVTETSLMFTSLGLVYAVTSVIWGRLSDKKVRSESNMPSNFGMGTSIFIIKA